MGWTHAVNSIHMRCIYTGYMCHGTEGSIQEGLSVRVDFLLPFFLSGKYSSRDFSSLDLIESFSAFPRLSWLLATT